MNALRRQAGFTLVELLVVTGLMAALLALVVAGLRPTAESQVRQAAALLRPAVMKTQSMALANPDGAALILKSESNAQAAAAAYGAPQPPIKCQIVSGSLNNVYASGSARITVGNYTNAADAWDGYRIRFGASGVFGEWFGFQPTEVNTNNQTLADVVFNPSGIQTAFNSVLPAGAPGAVIDCQITRYSKETTVVPGFAPPRVAIDLRYSGIGDDPDPNPRFAPRNLATLNALGDIALLFSRSGSLESVMPIPTRGARGTIAPAQPTAPLFLLLATRDDISANQSLQTDRSIWFAISPDTGAVTTGKNVPQANGPPIRPSDDNTSEDDWRAYFQAYRPYFQQARANARPLGYTGAYR